MSSEIKETDVTKKEIMERLDQLGVDYDPNEKKAVLLEQLNGAVEAPETPEEEPEEETSSSEAEESPVEPKVNTQDGVIESRSYKRSRRANMDTKRFAEEVAREKEERHDAKVNELLSRKGYSWYLCEARTVLEDGRVCQVGKYYPVHSDEVARVGTYTIEKSNNGKVTTTKRSRFKKETPEQGIKRLQNEEQAGELNPGDFVG